jgi:hypothetical protein
MRARAYRRHQAKRCLDNRKHDFHSGNTRKSLKKHVITPVVCSCWMCGNPRKYHKSLTLQEHRSLLNLKESLI